MKSKNLTTETFEEEDSPQRVDEILEARYGYGLYYFSHCLADLLYHEPMMLDSRDIFAGFKLPEKYWGNLIDILEDLKEMTLKRLHAIDLILETFDWRHTMPELYEYEEPEELQQFIKNSIKNQYKLNTYFKKIDKNIERLKMYKSVSPTDMRGRPLKARNLVPLLWSNIMKKPKTKDCDWKGMEDLFNWFSWNLKGSYYGNKLLSQKGEETFYVLDLKRVVLRLKTNLKKNEFLKEKVETLQGHYFSHKDTDKLTTIEFDREVHFADDAPSIGGEYKGLKWRDKNLLITFPNDKVLPRPGRPPEKEVLPEIDVSNLNLKTFDPNEPKKPKKK